MLASSILVAATSIPVPHHISRPDDSLRPSHFHSPRNGAATPITLPGSAATSVRSGYDSHFQHPSPSLLLSHTTPRSSILLNPKRSSYKGLVVEPTIPQPSTDGLRPTPVVKRIPAVLSAKAGERERERERLKEREKDRLKSKSEERIWGIPKKALLLGLGDLNINAQVAMLGGWGHGSGSATNLTSPNGGPAGQQGARPIAASPTVEGRKSRDASSSGQDAVADRGEYAGADDNGNDDEPIEKLDPEELAALNAIINTNRSMAAAQALVNGQVPCIPRSVRTGSYGSATSSATRPTLADLRAGSQDSVPSMSSLGQTTSNLESAPETLPSLLLGDIIAPSLPGEGTASVRAVGLSASLLASSPSRQARIRFAPLPQASGAPPQTRDGIAMGGPSGSDGTAHAHDSPKPQSSAHGLSRVDSNMSEDSESESDYDSDDASSAGKGKWYLMGMPSSVFKPEHYQRTRRRGRHSKTPSVGGFSSGEETADSKDASSVGRRKSTGSVSELFNQELVRMGWTRESTNAASDKDEDDRGRKSGRSRSKSRPSSNSCKSNRSSSRNGTRGSGDEDERARRRALIRMARPGGTGMVTLADGTKIRARRVNDPINNLGEPEFNEWGYAGLAKEASRRSLGAQAGGDINDPFEDEEDDGSGMAWVRRRRREREERARQDAEEAKLAELRPAAATVNGDANGETGAGDDTLDARAANAAIAAKALLASDCDMLAAPSDVADVGPPAESLKRAQTEVQLGDAAKLVIEAPVRAVGEEEKKDEKVEDEDEDKNEEKEEKEEQQQQQESREVALATVSETASLSGSGFLKRVESRTAEKTGATTPGLALSADQAEEIRRRHENEVYALGAEVLAQNRRNAQRRASAKIPSSSASVTPAVPASRPGKAAATAHSAQPGSKLSSKLGSRESSREGKRFDELQPLSSISKALMPSMRKATGDSERTISAGRQPVAAEETAPASKLPETPLQTFSSDQPVTVDSPKSSIADIREGRSHARHGTDAPKAAFDEDETLSRVGSVVGRRSSSASATSSPYKTLPGSASQASSLSVQTTSRAGASSSSKSRRIHLDPSVSVPAPSPWLPRRPDAKGMAVVPLPQLGIRPERPREGRVWQYDDDDDDDEDDSSDESQRGPSTRSTASRLSSHVDSDDDDLNAEELEEEERKTAMQKKRATTRAAGQEIVHSRSIAANPHSLAATDVKVRHAKGRPADEAGGKRSEGRSSTIRSKSIKYANSVSALRQRRESKSKATAATPSPGQKAPRSSKSFGKVNATPRHADGAEDDDDDEQNLWPAAAASASSKFGTPKPRHLLVNLPGGPGIWDSDKGGGANAVAAINSVAAARAKAIKQRAQKQKSSGKRESFELPEDWDDEMMDYGWPRSLKGSLY